MIPVHIRRAALLGAAALALSPMLPAPAPAAGPQSLAFPTALGYGRFATGWRGGAVMTVDKLDDEGPGTLRACAEARGPRVCVFAVSGTITVNRPIMVGSNVYIAGQTAPGQGIQLRLGAALATPLIIKNSHDVVVRFLKLRPGPGREPSNAISAILIEDSQTVIVDHCDIQFAVDQNFSVHFERAAVRDITLQRSLVAYGLDKSNHLKGPHSKGSLTCSGIKSGPGCGLVTIRENLFAHNRDRNPETHGSSLGPIEVINNILYDPFSQFGEAYDHYLNPRVIYLNNFAMVGPSTRKTNEPPILETYDTRPDSRVEVQAAGNLMVHRKDKAPVPAEIRLNSPDQMIPADDLKPDGVLLDARTLPDVLLPTIGARLPNGTMEDSLQKALVASVRERTGRVIDSPDQVGGWPEIPVERGAQDSDGDGMPDDWERARGLDARNASDRWKDRDGDGWSNLEEYLSVRAGDMPDKPSP
ncbi:hypothetical protein [Prosthecomicrobium sp. N25]|uniref:hypothetical protein n=1 Tax=Prosthecomicrobium sp. N25 TaxID=3129254 RepID=UPI003076D1A1